MTTTKNLEKCYIEVLTSGKLNPLREIGGCKAFHQEGNALIHTFMVVDEALNMWGIDFFFLLVALLHDIGKIKTGRLKADNSGDWEYPFHSVVGAQILGEFISPEECPEYKEVEWFIHNHIKPLFWRTKTKKKLLEELEELNNTAPTERCSIENLAKLAICDIRGSRPEIPQVELENYLLKVSEEGREYMIREA